MEAYDFYNSTYVDHEGHDGSYDISIHRLLASGGEKPTVDYSVISILVVTLALVLAIEVFRHQLDVAASGNQLFHKVLELMYRERELYCVSP